MTREVAPATAELERELGGRATPVLRDGTPLSDLINIAGRTVAIRVLTDPDIYELELEKVWAYGWNIVGHTAELPEAGDYAVRTIGEDEVVVTRDPGGAVTVLLNVCAHRGMQLCRAERGNTTFFKCPYHGWTFDGGGRLCGAPFNAQMYGPDWDRSGLGLRRARVEVRHGVIFATFADHGPSLDEFLGDYAWYLDRQLAGIDWVLNPATGQLPRVREQGNWKVHADQTHGDQMHFLVLHRSMFDLGLYDQARRQLYTKVCITPQGHTIRKQDQTRDFVIGDLSREVRPSGTLFPTSMIFPARMALTDGTGAEIVSLDVVSPKGIGVTERMRINLIDRDAGEELAQRPELEAGLRRNRMVAYSQQVPDDNEAFRSVTRSARGFIGRQQRMRYPASTAPGAPEGWVGPGTVFEGFSRDDSQWHFWLRWYDALTAPAP